MFKLNSNKAVTEFNKEMILPKLHKDEWVTRTMSLTPDLEMKLESLRAKYKISRSAVIRILLNNLEGID